MAENHPVAFQWVIEAKLRGAEVVHVDPRFTCTSANVTRHIPIRVGTDIALLGGLIRHVIETESYFRDYVVAYTNAPTIVNDRFRDTEDLDGLFSRWEPEHDAYERSSWSYHEPQMRPVAGRRAPEASIGDHVGSHGSPYGTSPRPAQDPTLQHPHCVFQILKRHFSRYTPELVERVTGVPRATFLELAQLGPRADGGARLLRGLDAAQQGRPDDPFGRDPPAPARQHRPAGRRDHRTPPSRQHPGLDRHPHPVQPPPRLPPGPPTATTSRTSTTTSRLSHSPGSASWSRSSAAAVLT